MTKMSFLPLLFCSLTIFPSLITSQSFPTIDLYMDECGVRVNYTATGLRDHIFIYTLSDDCYDCLLTEWLGGPVFSREPTEYITFRTKFDITFYIFYNNETISPDNSSASLKINPRQHAYYTLVYDETNHLLMLQTDDEGDNAYLPIYKALGVLIGSAIGWVILCKIWDHYGERLVRSLASCPLPSFMNERVNLYLASLPLPDEHNDEESKEGYESSPTGVNDHTMTVNLKETNSGSTPLLPKAKSIKMEGGAIHAVNKEERLTSLDTFRGISLMIMIFVNTGGGKYEVFNHSTWNGLSIADTVQPWFMWIMGTSMALAFAGLEKKRAVTWQVIYKIFRRFVLLFGLGLFLNNGFDYDHWRISGVLQRLAVAYFVCALIVWCVPHQRQSEETLWYEDITNHKWEWLVIGILQFIWLLVTYTFDVPGCGRGYLGPGGIGDQGEYFNCTGGAAGWVDLKIFGVDHIYQDPTCKDTYGTGAFDPEGFLGYFTSILMTYTGLQAGRILVYYKAHKQRILRFFAWAIVSGAIAMALTGGTRDDGVMPINWNLWTLSGVIAQTSTGFLCLIGLYWIIDVKHIWNGSPFIYPGMNSIAVYTLADWLEHYFPFQYKLTLDQLKDHNALLVQNIVCTGTFILVSYYMYCIDFFVKI